MAIKLPKGQKLWVTYRDERGIVRYAITSDPMRATYILWKVGKNGELEKRKAAKSPDGFWEIVDKEI